jgi:lipopolysaccharide/colanic/teichoic acid biosynthesis glycosyltransferase
MLPLDERSDTQTSESNPSASPDAPHIRVMRDAQSDSAFETNPANNVAAALNFPNPQAELDQAPTTSLISLERADVARARLCLRAGQPFVRAGGNRSLGYRAVKRLLDLVGALAGFVLFLPILVPVFMILMVTTLGRPFYCQERVGYCGRRFKMIKFRTMRLDADERQDLVPNEKDGPIFKNKNDPRVTWFGNVLRRTSIDEMPQLFNVLWGDMSLVGPRPALVKEVEDYDPSHWIRLCVMPGLTCLWQVSGRSDVSFEDWIEMDVWYIRNQSLWTDIKLLFRTPWSVVSMRGAY